MHTTLGRSISRSLDGALSVEALWHAVAKQVLAFVREQDLQARDTVVLLPFAQHLPLAQIAWAALPDAGWMPRFETTQTLARARGPLPAAPAGALCFDLTADALQADRLLRAHLPAKWQAERGQFDLLVRRVVETSHALARARLALPPDARPGWMETARTALSPASTARLPGAMERALARLALEWAETAPAEAADGLHAMRPAAWVALRAGAVDPLVEAVLSAAQVPALWLDANLAMDAVIAQPEAATPFIVACADFEDEAQRAAAQVLSHIERAETPVALIAVDRVLLRRVRALLERQHVSLADETGWRLSTTRAGAAIVGLLRAAQGRATTDDVLDWLASGPFAWPGRLRLEALWRRGRVTSVTQVEPATLDAESLQAWQQWQGIAQPLAGLRSGRANLGEWLAALREALTRAALWETLTTDAAGAQVLEALHCAIAPPAASVWSQHLQETVVDAPGFVAWVEGVLETEPFRPAPPGAVGEAAVFITPLARAMLRPFGATVCPGADAQRLGAAVSAQPLLGDALARALGVPSSQQQHDEERLAFAQLLRAPRLTLLYRCLDGAEPLQPSPWLLQLQWAGERAARPAAPTADPRHWRPIDRETAQRPLPSAAALLPQRLSASVYEDLRACPYRFFALHALRLKEEDELDDALDKRDYGSWLHEVLQAFHAERDAERPGEDHALLHRIAAAHRARLAREDADFLPFAAAFDRLVPHYLQWLHDEEATGWRVEQTELDLRARPDALASAAPEFHSRLDRVDAKRRGGQPARRVLDYKTTSIGVLQARLREPFEDTQLAFYAALLQAAQGESMGDVEAGYLAVDTREGVKWLPHVQVAESAAALVDGVSADFTRLSAGAAMPALGEGSACEHCSARGLCRRDHWEPGAG